MRRWWNSRSLRSKSFIVLGVPLVPLLFAVGLFVQSGIHAHEASQSVTRTLEVKAQIATVLHLIVDAEASVRGYLLTRSDDALEVYRTSTRALAPELRRLAQLVSDNPEQMEHLRSIVRKSTNRPLTSLLNYANEHPVGSQPPFELLEESRTTMAALRQGFADMQRVEDRLLVSRTSAVSAARQRELTMGSIAGLVALVAGAFAIVMLRRWTDTVERVRDEVNGFFSLSLDLLCIAAADGRFIRVNPAWTTVLGWSEAELTSSAFIEFVHPDDREATTAASARLAEGDTVVDFENRYRCKDGSYRWLNWRAAPARRRQGSGGRAPNDAVIYAAARDVTESKRLSEELEGRAAALAAANQELEAFTYSVSHDLRAPLRHVAGFAALLERHVAGSLDAEGRRFLDTISGAAKRMGQLIDDLLAFSRVGRKSLAKRTVKLDDIVREVQREIISHGQAGNVTWSVEPLPEVPADPAMLRLAFVNLLSNAVKYSASRADPRIEVGSERRNGEAVVFVRDNGVGFDMQYAHKLFGVFQRLHGTNEFEGTGIGLANVRRIIQRHGGRTWAEGAVDHGATFYFSLPLEDHGA